MTLGLGRDALVRIPTNERFELEPDELARRDRADRAAGRRPIAVVATLGTTSSTSVDPVAAIADIAEGEGLWLHVDCRLRRRRSRCSRTAAARSRAGSAPTRSS